MRSRMRRSRKSRARGHLPTDSADVWEENAADSADVGGQQLGSAVGQRQLEKFCNLLEKRKAGSVVRRP